jgi:hypothetical protein
MIPFLGFFLFAGIKLHIYHDVIMQHDNYSINALYASTDIEQLRNYRSDSLNDQFENKLIKYLVLEFPNQIDNSVEYQKVSETPLAMRIKTTVMMEEKNATIDKLYILDTRE